MLRVKDIKNGSDNDSYKKLTIIIRQVAQYREISKDNKNEASKIINEIRNYLSHAEHESSEIVLIDEIKKDVTSYCSDKTDLVKLVSNVIDEIDKDKISVENISLPYIGLLILYSGNLVDVFYNIWCGAVRNLIKNYDYFDDYLKIERHIIKKIYNEKSKVASEDFSYKTFIHEKLIEDVKDYPTVGVSADNWDTRFMENAFRFFTKELDEKPTMFGGIKDHNYIDANNEEQKRSIKQNLGKRLKSITFKKDNDDKIYVLSKIAMQRMLYNYVMDKDFNLEYKEPKPRAKKDRASFDNYLKSIEKHEKTAKLSNNSNLNKYLEKNWQDLNNRYNIYKNWQYKSSWLKDVSENKHNIAVSIYTYLNRMNNVTASRKTRTSVADKEARDKKLLAKYWAKKDEKPRFIALLSGLDFNRDSLFDFLDKNFSDLSNNYSKLIDEIGSSKTDTIYAVYKNLCDYQMKNCLLGSGLLKSFVIAKAKDDNCKMLDFFANKLDKPPTKSDRISHNEERKLAPIEEAFYKDKKLAIFRLPKLEKTTKISEKEYGSAYFKLQDKVKVKDCLSSFANGNKIAIDNVKKIIENKKDKLFFVAIDNVLLFLAYDKLSKTTNKSFDKRGNNKMVSLVITDSNNKESKKTDYIELDKINGKPIYIKRVNNSLVSYIIYRKNGISKFLEYLLDDKRSEFKNVKIANISKKYYDEPSKVYKDCYVVDENFFQSYVVDLGKLYEEIFEFEKAFCDYHGLKIDGLEDNHIKFCCYEAYASDDFFKNKMSDWLALKKYRNDICHVNFIDMTNKDKAINFIKSWIYSHKGVGKTLIKEAKYCNNCITNNKLNNK